jgi:ABC-type lipoprotein export system ATPase subunit/GNAT superfamily N-acetyltransferase
MSNVILKSGIERTGKVLQVEAMFDIAPSKSATTTIIDNIPDLSTRKWNIGLIVGASGSGKSTIARHHFGELVDPELVWDENKAVIDGFPAQMNVKDVSMLLSSVGFSSPPAWLRPYHTLSTGEKFRVSMARLLAEHPEMVVVDEFTSVVDRTVAKIGSTALAKTIRKKDQQFVAVSCHYDIKEWLAPDWTYEPATGTFRWESLRRPDIEVVIKRCHRSAWELFSRHHYLDHQNITSWIVYVAFVNGEPAAFCSVMPMPHGKIQNARRIARIVMLPDFQGVGVGAHLMNVVASAYVADGKKIYATTSHPAVINGLNNNPNWAMVRKPSRVQKQGKSSTIGKDVTSSRGRVTASFRFVGEGNEQARRLLPVPKEYKHG